MAMNLHKGDNVNSLYSKVINTIPYISLYRKYITIFTITIKTNNYGKELRRKIRFYLFSI